jgi:hypothetical protein
MTRLATSVSTARQQREDCVKWEAAERMKKWAEQVATCEQAVATNPWGKKFVEAGRYDRRHSRKWDGYGGTGLAPIAEAFTAVCHHRQMCVDALWELHGCEMMWYPNG